MSADAQLRSALAIAKDIIDANPAEDTCRHGAYVYECSESDGCADRSRRETIDGALRATEPVGALDRKTAALESLARLAMGWLHALYDGFPEQEMPDTDAGVLLGVAAWLDKADNVKDAYLAEHGVTPSQPDRSVQDELRRIAATLTPPGADQ